jgi:hypothetical protein
LCYFSKLLQSPTYRCGDSHDLKGHIV